MRLLDLVRGKMESQEPKVFDAITTASESKSIDSTAWLTLRLGRYTVDARIDVKHIERFGVRTLELMARKLLERINGDLK